MSPARIPAKTYFNMATPTASALPSDKRDGTHLLQLLSNIMQLHYLSGAKTYLIVLMSSLSSWCFAKKCTAKRGFGGNGSQAVGVYCFMANGRPGIIGLPPRRIPGQETYRPMNAYRVTVAVRYVDDDLVVLSRLVSPPQRRRATGGRLSQ